MEQARRPVEINGIRTKADADINPKLFEDLTIIAENFPCNNYVSGFLNMVVCPKDNPFDATHALNLK